MNKIFLLIILAITIAQYKSTGGKNNTNNNQTSNNKQTILQRDQINWNTNDTFYNPKLHEQILKERNQINTYRLDNEFQDQQEMIQKQLGTHRIMSMDEIREKLKNIQRIKGITKANQPVKAIHNIMQKDQIIIPQNDPKQQAIQKQVLKSILKAHMKLFNDPSAKMAKQELQFSKIVQNIRGFTMYLQQIVEKYNDEVDTKIVEGFEKIIFKLTPLCDNIFVFKKQQNDDLIFQYRFFEKDVLELREELERQLNLLTEKCYYQPQYLLCKIGYKNKLTDFTVLSDQLTPVDEQPPVRKTKFTVRLLKEEVNKKNMPALAAFYSYFDYYSIYDLTQSIRSSKLRFLLVDMFNLIEVSELKKVLSSQFITAIQNCFSFENINLNLIPQNDTLDTLNIQYSFHKEKVIKFIFELRNMEKLLVNEHSQVEQQFKDQSQKVINYLSELQSNNMYYLDHTDILINNQNLDSNPYENVDIYENKKIRKFMQYMTKIQNSKIYPELEKLSNLLKELKKDEKDHKNFEQKLMNLLEVIIHAFSSDNVEIQFAQNNKQVYYLYDDVSFISLTMVLNELDSFFYQKNFQGENSQTPYLKTLKPILDNLLLLTGHMDIQNGKRIEKIYEQKQRRRIVVLEILECEDCVEKNYTKYFMNQIN